MSLFAFSDFKEGALITYIKLPTIFSVVTNKQSSNFFDMKIFGYFLLTVAFANSVEYEYDVRGSENDLGQIKAQAGK